MRRSLRIVAFALLGLALLYLVPVNILLNTGLGPHLLSPYPDRFHADWSRAYSVWPGRVSATEVVIGGHSRRTIWRAEAATLSLVVDPVALLERQLLVRRTDVAALAVEVDRSDVDLPPRVPRSADGWTLIFDRINAGSVSLLRFDDLTLTGRGSAGGGFRKQMEASWLAGLQSRHLLPAKLLKQDRADATDTDALQGCLQICIHTSAASLLQRKPLGFTALFQARIHSVPQNPRAPPAI